MELKKHKKIKRQGVTFGEDPLPQKKGNNTNNITPLL
jgi:hypothetical protein